MDVISVEQRAWCEKPAWNKAFLHSAGIGRAELSNENA
jgi:hypothetical protein